MMDKLKNKILKWVNQKKDYLIISALASGLFPFFHYYNSNLTLINSWQQFVFFIIIFLVLPVLILLIIHQIFKSLKPFNKYIIAAVNFSCFAALIVISIYGLQKKILVLAIFAAVLLSLILYKHIKKIVFLQLLMAVLAFFNFLPNLYHNIMVSSNWMEQPDDIESVVFKNHPNVYLIQPDGYTNFSELSNEIYNFDNSEFEFFLKQNQFVLYNNFRSNYYTTLSSNTSLFSMKHHYHNNPKPYANELYNARHIIAGNNPVISIFKNNNYKTSLIVEAGNLLVNRPKLNYDYCNINYKDLPFLPSEIRHERDVNLDLEKAINNNAKTNNFYFIECLIPSHIQTYRSKHKGKVKEREMYLERLENANEWLKSIINLINENDNNALIIMLADHGGFVGMNYTREAKMKQNDRDLVYSVFSSALAIQWPKNAPEYDDELKTSVNLFRLLFAYLGEDEKYITNFQDDKSYLMIDRGEPFGVYECIDENGNIVFNKVNN